MSLAADLLTRLRFGAGFGRSRVLAYGGIALALELALFVFLIAGTHGLIVPLQQPTTTDFASFYAAGDLADAGTPALAYDQAAHYAAEQRATAPGINYQFFYYPPIFLMLCAALARLPYLLAFVVFEAATLLFYLSVARKILRDESWAVIVPLLAFPSVFWTLGLGQNAFLTAALFGAALMLVDRRPILSGILFGFLAYKPHFGLLIPIALAAGGRWRSFGAAAGSALALVLMSLLWFGADTWRDYLTLAIGSPATYENGRIDFAGFVSPFGAARLLGTSPVAAYAVQGVAAGLAACFVAYVWRRKLSLPLRAATLAAGTLAAMPVVLLYDLMTAAVAALWLIRAGREQGFLLWEKTGLAALFLVPLFSRDLGTASHVPLAPLALMALLTLIGMRLRHELGHPITVVRPAPRIAKSALS